MKKLLFILLVIAGFSASATNYYISAGGDNTTGLSKATAWQTIGKLNSSMAVINAGDSILFNRGEVFTGGIIITRDGNSSNPIVIAAYGTGAAPLISGFTQLSTWLNDGGGIYRAAGTPAKSNLILVTVDGTLQPLGRFPNLGTTNNGYYTYTAVNSSVPNITGVTTANDWTGAEVVIRKQRWVLDRCRVTSCSGGVVAFINPSDVGNGVYPGNAGNYGYFFQDDIRTLDIAGEWFLNKTTKDLSLFFAGADNPGAHTIKIATTDTLINVGGGSDGRGGRAYITVKNLAFEGANRFAIFSQYGTGINVLNCTFNNNFDAIVLKTVASTLLQYNLINNCVNNGINESGLNYPYGANILNDTVKNIGLVPGMGYSGDGTYTGIQQTGNNANINYNRVDSIGYCGIVYQGDTINVKYNNVSNFNSVKDDGAAYYTASTGVNPLKRDISFNNASGGNATAFYGTPGFTIAAQGYASHGYYVDAGSRFINVHDNTASNLTQGFGIMLNYATDVIIRNNLIYNTIQGVHIDRPGNAQLVRNITLVNNTIYSTTSNIVYWNGSLNYPSTVSIQQDIANIFAKIDSNYYRNDISAPFSWYYHLTNGGAFTAPNAVNLATWQATAGQDAHSNLQTGTNTLYTNPTGATRTINYVGFNKLIAGVGYDNSYTLPAFTGAILFDNGNALGVAIRHYFLKRKHK